jgi:signal transduction histidine kinase
MNRGVAVGIPVAAAAFGYYLWHAAVPEDPHTQWLMESLVAAWLWTVVGVFAWHRRPDNRTGKLMLLMAVALWLTGPSQATRVPVLWTFGSALEAAWFPVLAYLLFSFPNGRLTRRLDRVLVALACWPVIGSVLGSFFYDPRSIGCADCPADLNLLLIRAGVPDALETFFEWVSRGGYVVILTLIALPVLTVRRWGATSRPMRRVLSPILLPASALCLAVAAQQIIGILVQHTSIYHPTPLVFEVITKVAFYTTMALPLAFLLAVWRAWAQRGTRVGQLVVELGELPPLERLEHALSRALGDPSLVVARWDAERQRYLTSTGDTLAGPEEGSPRAATFLERNGRPLAVVVHDPALLEDRGLLDSVSAAARLAVENERLQAEIRAQLHEVRASRARIVAAGDAERRRLERDLHDGAQQRLVALALETKIIEARLGEEPDASLRHSVSTIGEGLTAALRELRELARGIHPSILTEEGLGPALRSLAERSAVPARLLSLPEQRFPAAVEAAAYFVVSEALANVAKHARASEVTIAVEQMDGTLVRQQACRLGWIGWK